MRLTWIFDFFDKIYVRNKIWKLYLFLVYLWMFFNVLINDFITANPIILNEYYDVLRHFNLTYLKKEFYCNPASQTEFSHFLWKWVAENVNVFGLFIYMTVLSIMKFNN